MGTTSYLEQLQHPEKTVKYLEKICCQPSSPEGAQIAVECWGIVYAYDLYSSLFSDLKRKRIPLDNSTDAPTPVIDPENSSKSCNRWLFQSISMNPVVTPTLSVSPAAGSSPLMSSVATPASKMGPAIALAF